jgi:2-polyprenyl-3-methyl-5-hydroxy-6-metoxy-1,4-benzoquinol methylase
MSTQGSLAGLETSDTLNVEYEHAYEDNKFKKACITKAISLLPPGSRALDFGCGTGVPVSAMLAEAGLDVIWFDISPRMVEIAQNRVNGNFTVSDMLEYKPEDKFAGVFMIFAHLQLSYADFSAAVYKKSQCASAGWYSCFGSNAKRFICEG